MKKKISLLLCILCVFFSMTGCSGKQKDTMTDAQLDSIEKSASYVIDNMLVNLTDEMYEQYQTMTDFELEYEIYAMNYQIQYYAQQGYDMGIDELNIAPDTLLAIMDAWRAAVEECGAYKNRGDFTSEQTSSGATLSVEAQFENRDAEIIVNFDKQMNLVSMDISAHFSTGEIMTKAGLNTLLGMGTVFAVLIFLALIIGCMKYISTIKQIFVKMFRKKETAEPIVTDADIPVIDDSEEVSDDLELIAVITAAIAAEEGTSTDGFVVRSIRRRPSNNWI